MRRDMIGMAQFCYLELIHARRSKLSVTATMRGKMVMVTTIVTTSLFAPD